MCLRLEIAVVVVDVWIILTRQPCTSGYLTTSFTPVDYRIFHLPGDGLI